MMVDTSFPVQFSPLLDTIAIGVVLAYLVFWISRKKNDRFLPMAPTSMYENVVRFSSTDSPTFVHEISQKMNEMNFGMKLPALVINIIGDYRIAREILKDSTSDKPEAIYKIFRGVSGKTMFTSSNDAYMKSLRKSTAHAFSKSEVGRMRMVAAKHLDRWMNGRLKKMAESGTEFDPAREFNYITFLVICEAAFEYEATEEEFEAFEKHANITLREYLGKGFNPFRRIFGVFIPGRRQAAESSKMILEFADRVLRAYRKNPNKSSNKTLIKILNDNTSVADDFQRRAEMKDWLIAGHDTTGYTLANTLTLLAKHPSIQTRLREALLATADPHEGCDYLQHVIKESMRVMPVAAGGSARITGKDIALDNGKILPKGSVCTIHQFLMNRNPSVYDKPESFIPERWQDPTEEMKVAMSPFSLGNRNCPGQPLAMSEINAVLPTIMTKFSFELVEEGTKTYFLTLKYKGTKLKAKML